MTDDLPAAITRDTANRLHERVPDPERITTTTDTVHYRGRWVQVVVGSEPTVRLRVGVTGGEFDLSAPEGISAAAAAVFATDILTDDPGDGTWIPHVTVRREGPVR